MGWLQAAENSGLHPHPIHLGVVEFRKGWRSGFFRGHGSRRWIAGPVRVVSHGVKVKRTGVKQVVSRRLRLWSVAACACESPPAPVSDQLVAAAQPPFSHPCGDRRGCQSSKKCACLSLLCCPCLERPRFIGCSWDLKYSSVACFYYCFSLRSAVLGCRVSLRDCLLGCSCPEYV